eukprot:7905573-Pyramimonas_sp.AAC.1
MCVYVVTCGLMSGGVSWRSSSTRPSAPATSSRSRKVLSPAFSTWRPSVDSGVCMVRGVPRVSKAYQG